VFLAVDGDERQFAIKVVDREQFAASDRDAHIRLEREWRLLHAIESPHVVRVHEFVRTESASCLVMELLSGPTLHAALGQRAGTPLPAAGDAAATQPVAMAAQQLAAGMRTPSGTDVPTPLRDPRHVAWALAMAVQVARGVVELHAINLVHRDLKPQNIMLVDDGARWVITDFGLARQDGLTTITQTNAIGTFAYMAPELFEQQRATPGSDVYALGAILYECLTGFPPHGGRDAGSIARRVRRRPVTDVRRLQPAVPADLAGILGHALEGDPRDRYADAAALLADLERCQRGERVQIPFSLGREFRHQRRRLITVALVGLLVTPPALLLMTGRARAIAGRMRTAASSNDPEGVAREWQSTAKGDQHDVLEALNENLPADIAPVLAKATSTGLLRLAAHDRLHCATSPSEQDGAASPPPLRDFVPLTNGFVKLVEPRYHVVWILAPEDTWWAADDPRVFALLRHVSTLSETKQVEPEEPWRALSIDFGLPDQAMFEFVRLAHGTHPLARGDKHTNVELPRDFALSKRECSCAEWRWFLQRLHFMLKHSPPVPMQVLAHPDEPPEACAAFDALVQATDFPPESDFAVEQTFWIAWRLAAFYGFVLPTPDEWYVAAQDGKGCLSPDNDKIDRYDRSLRKVTDNPGFDRTASGLVFTIGSAQEWLASFNAQGWVAFAPGEEGVGNGPRQRLNLDSYRRGVGPPTTPIGFRLARPLIAIR